MEPYELPPEWSILTEAEALAYRYKRQLDVARARVAKLEAALREITDEPLILECSRSGDEKAIVATAYKARAALGFPDSRKTEAA